MRSLPDGLQGASALPLLGTSLCFANALLAAFSAAWGLPGRSALRAVLGRLLRRGPSLSRPSACSMLCSTVLSQTGISELSALSSI